MLRVESLTKKFRSGDFGVRNFSLNLQGGIVGLLGPNGAGKTTLMQMIATILRPTSGNIFYQDVDVLKDPDFLRRRLGYLPQDFGIYDNLTAIEFLTYFASLKGVHDRNKIREMLEMVNLHSSASRLVGTFSGGMKQRLGIAQALINDPELLIVDEPTAGLDPEERVRFRNLLSEVGHARLVILSTHIVSDVESVATHIVVIKNGALIGFGAPEDFLQAAENCVWTAVISSNEFEALRTRVRICSSIRKPDGTHVRMVSLDRPFAGAVTQEANLEDAFLLLMDRR
jgi:ABC-2 type transport system ATP-binding protein